MDYPSIGKPFEFNNFDNLTKKQAKEYFEWYIGKIDERMNLLENYIKTTDDSNVVFDYSVESLITVWKWYENNISFEKRPEEEYRKEVESRPYWMKEFISEEEMSVETTRFAMDVAIYFAQVFIKHNPSVHWGYFTKPKSKFSVNRPVLLGFIKGKVLDPRNLVVVATLKSEEEKSPYRLYSLYPVWIKYIKK
jgi:hypothetical protein